MIVAVVNIKGGVGKTTTAIALATLAARAGLDTVVLDADEQSSASLWAWNAEQDGRPLPFPVESANIATLRRLGTMTADSSSSIPRRPVRSPTRPRTWPTL